MEKIDRSLLNICCLWAVVNDKQQHLLGIRHGRVVSVKVWARHIS